MHFDASRVPRLLVGRKGGRKGRKGRWKADFISIFKKHKKKKKTYQQGLRCISSPVASAVLLLLLQVVAVAVVHVAPRLMAVDMLRWWWKDLVMCRCAGHGHRKP